MCVEGGGGGLRLWDPCTVRSHVDGSRVGKGNSPVSRQTRLKTLPSVTIRSPDRLMVQLLLFST